MPRAVQRPGELHAAARKFRCAPEELAALLALAPGFKFGGGAAIKMRDTGLIVPTPVRDLLIRRADILTKLRCRKALMRKRSVGPT